MPRARAPLAAAVLVLAACGGAAGGGGGGGLPLGAPIVAPAGTWTWIDFPDASCGDGSPTGIAVNPGNGPDLVVYLEGGGACWSYATCLQPGLFVTTLGPFGAPQFQALAAAGGLSGWLDRSAASHPLPDATLVYVPYCTGDVHGGNRAATYRGDARALTVRHVGHQNVLAYLRRLGATFPQAPRVVVSGSSAGGFGAVANYEFFRAYWPAATMALVDDSGPPLAGTKAAVDAFDAAWGIYDTLAAFCLACRDDLSNAFPALAQRHPADRLSLLSYEQDTVIPLFFGITSLDFTARLGALLRAMDGTATTKYFAVGRSGHTLLRDPGVTAQGTPLWQFLGGQVSGAPGWASRAD